MGAKVATFEQCYNAEKRRRLLINDDISTPIPLLKRGEWQKERNAKAKEIVTILQQQLLSVSKLHKKQINNVGKQMYSMPSKKSLL